MLLVLTQPKDETVDPVIAILRSRGYPVVRFDTSEFPVHAQLVADLGERGWRGRLTTASGQAVSLDEIATVWYRRPLPFTLPDGLTREEQTFAREEARHAVAGLLSAATERWVNPLQASVTAGYKPLQLMAAQAEGLAVPTSMVTNDPEAGGDFCAANDDDAIYKSFQGGLVPDGTRVPVMLYTTAMSADRVRSTPGVRHAPCLFQRRIDKRVEVRALVIGDRVLAAEVDSQASDDGRIDWRRPIEALHWHPHDLPEEVATRLRAVVLRLGLAYGVVDLILTPQGEYVFLEVNPDGQWMWLEMDAGLPIAEAFADFLSSPGRAVSRDGTRDSLPRG